MNKKNNSIGIFDSGVGGLTVLSEAMRALPNESFIYFCDHDNLPYGSKSGEEILKISENIIRFLIERDCKAIVIACNTATSVASEKLREEFKIPIIGIEPAVKKAFVKNQSKETLVLATPVTLKEEKFKNLLEEIGCVDTCHILPSEDLANIIEDHLVSNFDHFVYSEKIEDYLKKILSDFDLNKIDTVVLGCTHYGFLSPYFNKILPSDTNVIDGGYGTVRYLKRVLEEKDMLADSESIQKIDFFGSGEIADDIDKICRGILENYL